MLRCNTKLRKEGSSFEIGVGRIMQEVDLCDSLTDELDIQTTIIQNTSEPQNKPFVPKVLLGIVVSFSHATL
jgi:hypothetical protein